MRTLEVIMAKGGTMNHQNIIWGEINTNDRNSGCFINDN